MRRPRLAKQPQVTSVWRLDALSVLQPTAGRSGCAINPNAAQHAAKKGAEKRSVEVAAAATPPTEDAEALCCSALDQ